MEEFAPPWASEHVVRMGQIIRDIDPTMRIVGIPPRARETLEENAKPYAIQVTEANGYQYIYRTLSEADMQDHGTITKLLLDKEIWGKDIVATLKAEEYAKELMDAKKAHDENEALADELHALGKRLKGTNKTYHM